MSMYLEAELGALGAMASTSVVNNVQQLDPGTAAAVMAYLSDKYIAIDPEQQAIPTVSGFIVGTAQQFKDAGAEVPAQTADQAVQGLPADQTALVLNAEVASLPNLPAFFHIKTAPSDQVVSLAAPGSDLSVLWPLKPMPGTTTEEKKKSAVAPVVGALIGGGAGALVAGPIGAIVGGIGGFLVGNAVA